MEFRKLRIALLALCIGGSAASIAAADPTPAETADPNAMPPGVSAVKRGDRWSLVDQRGMTIYYKVYGYCGAECRKIWPVLEAPADAKPFGAWNVIKTDGSSSQWTYNGTRLYTFLHDDAPGSAAGDGFGGLWKVIEYTPPASRFVAPPAIQSRRVEAGYVLADQKGSVLYTREAEERCTGACQQQWTPLAAGMAAIGVGDWRVSQDGDGAHWTYRGQPVYTYAGASADANGAVHGAQPISVPEDAPRLP